MGSTLGVRRFRSGDTDAVWSVHERALRASPLTFVEDAAADADLRDVQSAYLDAGGEFLVGECETSAPEPTESTLVGIGGYLPVDERTIQIRRMRVHPDHQRRGFATELLAELEARATAEGFAVAVLETIETLRAARAFYDEAGYQVIETWEDPATGLERYRYRKRL